MKFAYKVSSIGLAAVLIGLAIGLGNVAPIGSVSGQVVESRTIVRSEQLERGISGVMPSVPPEAKMYPYPDRSTSFTVTANVMVSGVRVTSFSITDERRITVGLRYSGTGSSPGVTVIISTGGMTYPLPAMAEGPQVVPGDVGAIPPAGMYPSPYPRIYPNLIGSNVKASGWEQSTLNIPLVGQGSLFDANAITVSVIPFTG